MANNLSALTLPRGEQEQEAPRNMIAILLPVAYLLHETSIRRDRTIRNLRVQSNNSCFIQRAYTYKNIDILIKLNQMKLKIHAKEVLISAFSSQPQPPPYQETLISSSSPL
jgi:hypothetical protein